MLSNFILDTTVLIDQCFGSKQTKKLIDIKLRKSQKYTTYLILGEFNRTILNTFKNILNIILRNKDDVNDFENISDFISDVIKDIYFFSGQEANRVIKLVPYLKKEIEKKIEKYHKFNISLRYPLLKIIDDINMYRYSLLSNIILLESSFECQNYLRKLYFKSDKNKIVFDNLFCTFCEMNILKFFKETYFPELNLFHKNIELLTKSFRKDEKEKLLNALNFILKYINGAELDGRKRICWNLIDIFLVLETPKDFIILTTNIRHQESFAKCINKRISNIK